MYFIEYVFLEANRMFASVLNLEIVASLLPAFLVIEVPLLLLIVVGILRWLYGNRNPGSALSEPATQTRAPKVSCVITCYSEGETVAATLTSLREQQYEGVIEIIPVIDGAVSNRDTYEAARRCESDFENFPLRKLIVLPKWQRGGRVSSLNTGLDKATGEIVMALDGDTSFDNTMIRETVKSFTDPTVVAAGGMLRVRNIEKSWVTRMQAIEYVVAMLGSKTGLSQWNLLDNVSGAFGAFRTNFLRTIGGWDTHTAEDMDLSMRIKQYRGRYKNLRIGFNPRSIGHTDVPDTFRDLLFQRLRWDGDLAYMFLRKHRPGLSPKLLGHRTFWFSVVYGIGQNLALPVVIFIFMCYLIFFASLTVVLQVTIAVYLLYLCTTLLVYLLVILSMSERLGDDLKLLVWIPIFPVYSTFMRIWSVVTFANEIFRRGHEETTMAPWWVLKRGNRF